MHRKRARSGHITALAVDVPVGANEPHLTVAKWKHSSQNIRWIFLRCAWPRIIILHLANLLGTAWLLVCCLHAIGSPHFDDLFTCPHFCHNCGGYLAINGCFAAAQMKTQATLPWWKVLQVMTSTHHRICQQPQLRCARVRSLNRTRIPVLWVQEWTKLIIVNIAVVISVHHLCQNVYVLADIKSCWVMLQCCNSRHMSWWIGTMKSGAPWPSSHMRLEGPFALLPCGLVCCPLVQFWKHAWPLRSSHYHHGPRLGMKPWQKRNDSGKSIGIPAALSVHIVRITLCWEGCNNPAKGLMISAGVPDQWAIHPSPGHRTSWANNSNPKGTQRFLDSLVHYTPLGDHHPCLGGQDRIDTWKVTATARDVQTTEVTYEIWRDIGKLW